MKSIWTNYLPTKKYDKITENLTRDIVVVGGGIAGICAAYCLAESGKKVTLIERNTILSGVTVNTTAHLTYIHGYNVADIYDKSTENAAKFVESQKFALDKIEQIISKESIDCDFKKVDGYIYTFNNKDKLKHLYDVYKNLGVEAEWIENHNILGFGTAAAIKLTNQGIFNPVKFASAIIKDIEIYENSIVTEIDTKKKIIYANGYVIQAKSIIVATNFPIVVVPGYYFLKEYKSTSYAVITPSSHDIDTIYQGDEDNGITFRGSADGVIIGGLDHRTGRLDSVNKFNRLQEISNKYFNAQITNKWLANDCITNDGIPLVGKLSKSRQNIYVITGFNKWGMLNSMVSGQIIADAVNNVSNPYAKLFCPSRKKVSLFHCITNIFVTIANLLIKPLNLFVPSYKKLPQNTGKIVWYKGKIKAVYKDSKGQLHICQSKCSHLKCKLAFNSQALSWDCPCHGSRFTIDGDVITAPAVESIKSNHK